MSGDKQNEIHELAKQMSEAISTAVEQRYIEDEAKLRAVLIENGWRESSEVASDIFAEIETSLMIESFHGGEVYYAIRAEDYLHYKKKYTQEK